MMPLDPAAANEALEAERQELLHTLAELDKAGVALEQALAGFYEQGQALEVDPHSSDSEAAAESTGDMTPEFDLTAEVSALSALVESLSSLADWQLWANEMVERMEAVEITGSLATLRGSWSHSLLAAGQGAVATEAEYETSRVAISSGIEGVRKQIDEWQMASSGLVRDLGAIYGEPGRAVLKDLGVRGQVLFAQDAPSYLQETNYAASTALDGLEESVQSAANALRDQAESMLTDIRKDVEERFRTEVEDAVREQVNGPLRDFMAELSEKVGSVAAGQSITAALGPWLPKLKALKHALHLINDVLDQIRVVKNFVP